MNTAIFAAMRAILMGVRRRGAALSRSGIIGTSGRARAVIDRRLYYRRAAGRRETARFAYARRRSICRRMISSRGAIAVVTAIGAAVYALGSLATAHSIPSAAKPPIELSPRKINFGKVPAGMPIQQTPTLTNKSSVILAAPAVSVTGTGFTLGTNG